jgi:CHASE2 domain-containing sensor protein
MTRTLATLFGLAYAALGVAGLFDTAFIGRNGFISADLTYSYLFLAVSAVLLFAALLRREHARRTVLTVGVVLALVAVIGLAIAPQGTLFGMLANSAGHLMNLAIGVTLAGIAFAERSVRRESQSLRDIGYLRHARHA